MPAGMRLSDADYVVFYDKPFLKFERLLETYLAFAPAGFSSFAKAMPLWLTEKLFQKDLLVEELRRIDPDFDRRAAGIHRAPSFACGKRVLSVAVRRSGGVDDRRRGRKEHNDGRDRSRQQS